MNFVTIYDFTKETPSCNAVLLPLLFFIIGLFVFFVAYNSTPDISKPVNSLDSRTRRLLIGGGFIAFTLFSIYGIIDFKHSTNSKTSEAISKNKIKIVEGKVENYHPMPKEGHDQEKFDVNGIHFEFSDYTLTDEGYHNAASHGGAIKQGLYVRVNYYESHNDDYPENYSNVITKLEIAE